ncbi:MAG TPA: hypothetical protein VG273_08545 [Bryobacteraceae bacterium]|jgi:hypothetical protein|nr:hypothetical protein [Bryobacteraceae bacterium]
MKTSVRFVLVHYHILKNAGTTIEEFLDHSFHEGLLRLESDGRDGILGPEALLSIVDANPGILAVSSHQIRHPLPETCGTVFFDLCFLRDPLDRVRSLYDYFRHRPANGEPLSELANRSNLGEFVAAMVEEQSLHVRNVQVNLIAQAGDSDEPTPADLETAWDRIQQTSFLGVVDCFHESVVAGQYFLKAVFPSLNCDVPPANTSNGLEGTLSSRVEQMRAACKARVFDELVRITALDSELVRRAREEVRRRYLLVPERERRLGRPGGKADREPGAVKRPVALHVPSDIGRTPVPVFQRAANILASAPVILRRTPLFDSGHYCARQGSLLFPKLHYLVFGAFKGANPHPLFDSEFYRRNCPEALNPLAHYIEKGARRNAQPHPLFDGAFYLAQNEDVRIAGLNPLAHYIEHGSREGRKPHPWFQPDYYLAQCPEVCKDNGNPLVHFASQSAPGGNPHRLFDCDSYREAAGREAAGDSNRRNPLVEALSALPAGNGSVLVDDIAIDLVDEKAPPERRRFLRSLNRRQAAVQGLLQERNAALASVTPR